jgi:hypothetical protein
MRMSFESMVVLAHAMGRTLVLPPNLDHNELLPYLNSSQYKSPHHSKIQDKGFLDVIDVELLKSQQGVKIITMQKFLELEGCTGRLKEGKLPPNNDSSITGSQLWEYLKKATDIHPELKTVR